METARERVFQTEELFEGILFFLPFKKLFYIRRVSKRWADGIDESVTLQQKMFLRPRDQPELWVVDRKHKVGVRKFKTKYAYLNDTELSFRRVKIPQDDAEVATPITLNPMLANGNIDSLRCNAMRVAVGCEIEIVTYQGWVDALGDQDNSNAANTSFWNTFLTDPPCHKVEAQMLMLRLDDTAPPWQSPEPDRIPITARVRFAEPQHLTIESGAGVRMRDVLLPCLTARGDAWGRSPESQSWKRRGATIRDAIEALKDEVGGEGISTRWGLLMRLRLFRVGNAQPVIATDGDRAAVNKYWE
jgi:hypothetical protein